MKHLKQIFILLDKWRYHYLLAALLLMVSVFVRSVEPKILQLAIDGVINWHNSAGKTTFVPTDFVSKTLYSLLPTATMQNVQQLLFLLVTMFMTIALLRGLSSSHRASYRHTAPNTPVKACATDCFYTSNDCHLVSLARYQPAKLFKDVRATSKP